MNGEITVSFSREKETKNTIRFKEDGQNDQHKIGTIYIKKDAYVSLGSPESIIVSVEIRGQS